MKLSKAMRLDIGAMPDKASQAFFSYAGEDAWWVDLFREYFNLGPVRILDYRADAVPYGPLGEALKQQITGAAAVLAFVSAHYRSKQWTIAEWEKGLDETARRRLIFVPIMLDADAIVWWLALRHEQRLSALSRDYQYADFTDGGRGYALPGPRTPQTIRKIANLALAVRQDLGRNADGSATSAGS